MPSPYFVNVYWGMPRTVPVAGAGNPTDPGALSKTSDRIDAFTRALVHSDYFLKAAQYQIPGPFEMGPSVYVDANTCPGVPIPTTIGSEHGDGHEAHGLADALIECLKLQHPEWDTDRLVLNLILPASVAGIKADGWCPGALADHGHFGGSPATFMPTSCSGSFTTFSTRLTHEMIEAITRAHPIGGYYDIWPSSTYFQNEVGDNCNGGSPMVPGAPYTQNFLPTLGGIAGLYWSNSDNGCVSGLPTQGPNTPGITMRGSGKNMTIDLTGDFGGTLPDDLAANTYSPGGGMNTAFIEAEISGPTHDWTAGNFLRFPVRDRVGFRTITWTRTNGTDSIHLGGFDGNYVAGGAHSVRPGDTITVTITSPKSGLTTTKSDTTNPGSGYGTLYIAPVTGSPHKWVFFNDGARLEGSGGDFYGEPVEGTVVHI
ncbi:MAG: hypothetical protein JST92_26645, partial [Deltaproteobacteria bacterium]|nr:hypothetical protein [Deltaproteobacteria bacterium]